MKIFSGNVVPPVKCICRRFGNIFYKSVWYKLPHYRINSFFLDIHSALEKNRTIFFYLIVFIYLTQRRRCRINKSSIISLSVSGSMSHGLQVRLLCFQVNYHQKSHLWIILTNERAWNVMIKSLPRATAVKSYFNKWWNSCGWIDEERSCQTA